MKDYSSLDAPELLAYQPVVPEIEDLRILRMLVRPKYGALYIPEILKPLQLVTAVKAWNSINGAKKQAYITLVLTTNSNPEYANLLAHTWYLGPKNGLTFVMSLNEGIIQWARLVSFSEDTSLHRWTADELTGYPLESAWELISEAVLQEHTRTPMKNYEYLKKNIRLSIPALFLIILFQVFGTAIAYVIILKLSGDSYARYNRWY